MLAWLCLAPVATVQAQDTAARDGQHDFDFNIGVWRTHIRRIPDPYGAPDKTVELNGTVSVRKVWKGRAQLEEIEADGPNGHWEGMTLFLYNPVAHQWTQTFADSKSGVMELPLIGSFHDGRGELYAQDTFQNKAILVPGTWSAITPDAHHFEEDYSKDGGRTWAPTFVAELTRETGKPTSVAPDGVEDAEQHAFDWDLGRWRIEMARLSHPLTGSTTWTKMVGTTVNSPLWKGRANLAEVEADGPGGHLELLALRLYLPATHEWTTHFATSGVGVLDTPTGRPIMGSFQDGKGVFYDQEPYTDGRSILVRFKIGPLPNGAAESRQAFSGDGGKTWEVNWVNHYERLKSE